MVAAVVIDHRVTADADEFFGGVLRALGTQRLFELVKVRHDAITEAAWGAVSPLRRNRLQEGRAVREESERVGNPTVRGYLWC